MMVRAPIVFLTPDFIIKVSKIETELQMQCDAIETKTGRLLPDCAEYIFSKLHHMLQVYSTAWRHAMLDTPVSNWRLMLSIIGAVL